MKRQKIKTYNERGDIRSQVERYLRKNVEYDQARAAAVKELGPRAARNNEEQEKHQESPELDHFRARISNDLDHRSAANHRTDRHHDERVQTVVAQGVEN